jgi:hypothetical protein
LSKNRFLRVFSNAEIISLSQFGNFKEAGFSAIVIIPVVGDAASAGRKVAKAGDIAEQVTKHAEDLVDTGKNAAKQADIL